MHTIRYRQVLSMTNEFVTRFINARRNYIASTFNDLNDMQLEAAMATEGPLLLLAGAGSGKTTVLINRIANLMRFGCGSDTQYHYVTLPALRAHNLGAADLQGTANLNPSLCSLPRMAFGHSLSAIGSALAVPSARFPRL